MSLIIFSVLWASIGFKYILYVKVGWHFKACTAYLKNNMDLTIDVSKEN